MARPGRLGAVLVMVITGVCGIVSTPGCDAGLSPVPLRVVHDSPRALVRSYEKAVVVKDYAAIADAIAPEIRGTVEAILVAYRHYRDQEGRTREAIRRRFGRRMSETFHESLCNMIDLKGALLWNAPVAGSEWMRIEARGDVAMVVAPNGEEMLVLKQCGEQWYVGLDDDHKGDLDAFCRLAEDMATWLKYISLGIRSGTIDHRNVTDVLSSAQSPPGMPTKDETEWRTMVE